MVWAIDLDDPATGESSNNLNLNGLREIGDAVDTNPIYARQKLAATYAQNTINLLTFWTDCSANPTCPDGFKILTTGHGKVSLTRHHSPFIFNDLNRSHRKAPNCINATIYEPLLTLLRFCYYFYLHPRYHLYIISSSLSWCIPSLGIFLISGLFRLAC